MSLEHVQNPLTVTVSSPASNGDLILPIAPTGSNSFPSKCLPVSICEGAGQTSVVSHDDQHGFDLDTGFPVIQRTLTYEDGTFAVLYFQPDGVTLMTSTVTNFTATPAQTENDIVTMYATNTDDADASYGEVLELREITPFVDGVLDAANVAYWDYSATPPVDVTATVTVAPYERALAPVRVDYPDDENLAVTGTVGVALAAIPAFATYAEVYVDAPDAGISWTTDGTDPVDNNRTQQNAGTTIKLLDRSEIEGFRAVPMNDGTGVIDGALTANLKIRYTNIAPDED